jgi:hypothetical protein
LFNIASTYLSWPAVFGVTVFFFEKFLRLLAQIHKGRYVRRTQRTVFQQMLLHFVDHLGGAGYVRILSGYDYLILPGGYPDVERFTQKPQVAVRRPEQIETFMNRI